MSILDQFRIDGKTALVTGARRGIGRAMAVALAEAGADIVAASAQMESGGGEVAREIVACRRRSWAYGVDLADRGSVYAFIAQVKQECPPIDILVNNGGAILRKPAVEHPDEYWDRIIEIDLNAQWVLAREIEFLNLAGPFDRRAFHFVCSRRKLLLPKRLLSGDHEDHIVGHQAEHRRHIACFAGGHPLMDQVSDRLFVTVHHPAPVGRASIGSGSCSKPVASPAVDGFAQFIKQYSRQLLRPFLCGQTNWGQSHTRFPDILPAIPKICHIWYGGGRYGRTRDRNTEKTREH